MWAAAVQCSAILEATSREIIAESLMLKVRAREACHHARRLCGGSDADEPGLAPRIVTIILEQPTCLRCIVRQVDAPALTVIRAMERIRAHVVVEVSGDTRCRACGSSLGPICSLPG
jgi:hypothetical protein